MGITHSHPRGLSLCLLEVHVYLNSFNDLQSLLGEDMCQNSDYKTSFLEPGAPLCFWECTHGLVRVVGQRLSFVKMGSDQKARFTGNV